jgi:uncharacterized protein
MMIPENRSSTRHPFMSLINLLFVSLSGALLFTIFGMFICYLLYGDVLLKGLLSGALDIESLKIIQFFSSVGTFICPSLFFAWNESKRPLDYLRLNTNIDLRLIILSVVILISFTPFVEWLVTFNKQLSLPSFLGNLEDWMKEKEDAIEKVTLQFLLMKSPVDLIVNLILIAVIPAIGEELFFRGCLQKVFGRLTRNKHLAIWLTAIVFSGIHLQFYGFFPRMFLGALFGYLFLWSKNLWIPIIAHFINNGFAVVSAYIIQQRGDSLETIGMTPDSSPYMTILSFVFTVILLKVFLRVSTVKDGDDE